MPDQDVMGRTIGDTVESPVSAVSWPAIFAGGFTALTVTLILLMVGTGLGFSAISPWSGRGVSSATLALTTVIWLIVVQWLSAGVGGYVTGRLRTRWTSTHRDEVFFRDTAHGFLAWSVATLVGVALFGSAVSAIIGAGANAVGTVAQGAAEAAASTVEPVSQYDLDRLLRPAQPGATSGKEGSVADFAPEVMHIVGNGIATGEVPQADRTYLSQLVANRAGLSPEDARQRVDQVIDTSRQAAAKAKQAAETTRSTAAKTLLFGALAMLIGAFVASAAAAYGGHLRDEPA